MLEKIWEKGSRYTVQLVKNYRAPLLRTVWPVLAEISQTQTRNYRNSIAEQDVLRGKKVPATQKRSMVFWAQPATADKYTKVDLVKKIRAGAFKSRVKPETMTLLCEVLETPFLYANFYSMQANFELGYKRQALDFESNQEPIILPIAVDEIPMDDKPMGVGHAFTAYIGKTFVFLCDNNGNKYDHHSGYVATKRNIMAFLEKKTGKKVLTNQQPTYEEKNHCAYATLETIAKLQTMTEREALDCLLGIEFLSKEARLREFPSYSLKTLAHFARPILDAYVREHEEQACRERGLAPPIEVEGIELDLETPVRSSVARQAIATDVYIDEEEEELAEYGGATLSGGTPFMVKTTKMSGDLVLSKARSGLIATLSEAEMSALSEKIAEHNPAARLKNTSCHNASAPAIMHSLGEALRYNITSFTEEPIIVTYTIGGIQCGARTGGHCFTIYAGAEGIFLCDNNGEKYRAESTGELTDYSVVKDSIMSHLQNIATAHGLKKEQVLTNINPTYNDAENKCSFAAMSMAKKLAESATAWEDLCAIDTKSRAELDEEYPSSKLHRLPSFDGLALCTSELVR